MKRTLCLALALLFAVPLVAETKSRYLVATRRPAAKAALDIIRDIEQVAAHDVRTYETLNFFAADLTESEVAALRKSPEVRYVSAVVERHIALFGGAPPRPAAPAGEAGSPLGPAVNSRYSKSQTIPYGIDLIGARTVWPAFAASQKGITNLVVIDTGIETTHPDLKDRYAGGYNVFTKTDDPTDDHGHGTHVAGTIAAVDNGFGVVGVAPNVRLWAVKVLRANGFGTDETVTAGVDWVRKKKQELGGNWIMSLSLGSANTALPEREAFAAAIADGILVVAAAGNRAARSIDYPAAYQGVLAISAIDSESKIGYFSSYGSGVAFAAPGVDVLSTMRVGTVPISDLFTDKGTTVQRVFTLDGSSDGEVTADFVVAGEGAPEHFPADTAGKIAIVSRSAPVPPGAPACTVPNTCFRDKVNNAVKAGAIAVVVRANDSRADMASWTLQPVPSDKFPIVVSVGLADGQKLAAAAGKEKLTVSITNEDYGFLSGTSMATPHVSGAAALIWSLAPNATAEQVRLAMKLTADDLGAKYYDELFGYGRINPLAAAKYLAPATFDVAPPAPLDPKRKRQGH